MKTHESKERKHLIVNTPCLLYTPRLKDTGERLRLLLNEADWAVANRYRGTFRVRGIVTDQNTGKRYKRISQKEEEKQMAKLYHVVWEIDIYARSPREAAKKAQEIQQDWDTTATVFDVTKEGSDKTVRIDLGEGS
jgi:hypothetical protein